MDQWPVVARGVVRWMKRLTRPFMTVFWALILCTAAPSFAAITFFASAANPADNGSLTDSVPQPITPPAGMQVGDLVYLIAVVRSSTETLTLSNTGGQTWTSEAQHAVAGSGVRRIFHARFNGTWSANPTVDTVSHGGLALTLVMAVFRPTNSANTWGVDVAQATGNFTAPGSAPFNITATGQTALAASSVTVVAFATVDDNTWALQTAGWSSPGGTPQFRNTSGNDTSLSIAYKIQTAAGATGNVTDQQTAMGGDNTRWSTETFKEIAGAGDTQAPTVPSNLTATVASHVGLTWTASTDNVAVTGYEVQRCQGSGCTPSGPPIGTPIGTAFTDTAVSPATLYRYRVRAKDAVPNFSGYSSLVNATTNSAGCP